MLAQDADIVLYAAPAVVTAADASLIASALDGVLLVISKEATRESVQATLDQLGRVRASVCGFVLT